MDKFYRWLAINWQWVYWTMLIALAAVLIAQN